MIVLHHEFYYIHNPDVPPGYPEKPYRVQAILSAIRKSETAKFITTRSELDIQLLKRIHTDRYLDFLQSFNRIQGNKYTILSQDSRFIHDLSSPVSNHTFTDAIRSGYVAYESANMILKSDDTIYALCRPPGHHAMKSQMGGFCYINNAAIAAEFLSKHGKVAILDMDFHHGNGTQDIFYERDDVLYVSIHEDPRVQYPYDAGFAEEEGKGKGKGYNRNFPLSPGTDIATYEVALQKSLEYIDAYEPAFLIVSIGYDTYENDLLGDFKLTTKYYKDIATRINSLKIPTILIQEGGYHQEIGDNAVSFIKGFSSSPRL